MDHIFSDEIVTAKKRYRCDASERWVCVGYTICDCEDDDRQVQRSRQ
jgi:hypothetical protein